MAFDYDKTLFTVERFRDDERFEQLGLILVAQIEPTVRPLGGSGDRARDGAGGVFRFGEEDELIVMVSLEEKWDRKIGAELNRIAGYGRKPKRVIALSNRDVTRAKEQKLEEKAAERGWQLRVYGQRWFADRLHLPENIELRRDFLGLDRPRPPFFLDTDAYHGMLADRQLLDVEFVGRERELADSLTSLAAGTALTLVEADGGIGKTRFALELAERDERNVRWFFAPYGLAFDDTRLNELGSGAPIVVAVDDAHRRDDLSTLLAALERRTPPPQILLIARPGHRDALLRAQSGLALGEPATVRLLPFDRPDIVALLTQPPLSITRQGMLTSIVTLSGGNPQIALIAGRLAAAGVEPTELSAGSLFRQHVESLLAASLEATDIARELLAVAAALGALDTTDAPTMKVLCRLLGIDEPQAYRLLAALADGGLLVEESSNIFTTKPDILREQLLRFSFFDAERRPRLPYPTVYVAFAPRRRALLTALGEARVGDLPAAAAALRQIRRDLLADVSGCAPGSLVVFVRVAESLGAGVPNLSLDLVDAARARSSEVDDAGYDELAAALVAATSRAKFGDFVRGWQILLALGGDVFAREAPEARAKLIKELAEAYGCCPVDYSPDDPKVLAGVQGVMRVETKRFFANGYETAAGVMTAAVAARALLAMTFEKHQVDAADVMTFRLYGVGLPATESTRQTLLVGARLFRETMLALPPRAQLEQLEPLRELVQVAAGHAGLYGYEPTEDQRDLAERILSEEIEPWLRDNIDAFSPPVAAEILDHFAWRTRHGRSIKGPRVSARLREYVDLVHSGARLRPRVSFERAEERMRVYVERYGQRLAKTRDPEGLIARWNEWVEEASATMEKLPWHQTLPLALARAAEINPERGRELATKIVEDDLVLLHLARPLLATVAAGAEPDFVVRWVESPRVELRLAAVAATRGLDDGDARPLITALAADDDTSVRSATFDELIWSRPLSGWVLETVLGLAGEGGLDRLGYVLGRLRADADEERREVEMPARAREAVTAMILETAAGSELPRHHTVKSTLELAISVGLNLTMAWVYARVAYLERDASNQAYPHVLPDELASLLPLERARNDWVDDLARLCVMYEAADLHCPVRESLQRAISWLAGDTPELTAVMLDWAHDGEARLAHATTFLGATSDWVVFTERARGLIELHPHDPRLAEAIIHSRRPGGFTSGGEPFRERAELFATWLDDPIVGAIGAAGRDEYNRLAEEAIEIDRRERQSFP